LSSLPLSAGSGDRSPQKSENLCGIKKKRKFVMKIFNVLCVLAVLVVSGFAFGGVETFNDVEVDIESWTGTGSNEALLVIDWNDEIAPAFKVWGYRWDGSATPRDMINAIKAADLRLFEADGGWNDTGGESTVYGFGYDADNDGGSFIETGIGVETGYATDADDHYKEGWYYGFWSHLGTSSVGALDWAYPGAIDSFELTDGFIDGFAWDATGLYPSPVTPTIPEPCTMALFGLGSLVMIRRRNK
jgi:hypothetical protein